MLTHVRLLSCTQESGSSLGAGDRQTALSMGQSSSPRACPARKERGRCCENWLAGGHVMGAQRTFLPRGTKGLSPALVRTWAWGNCSRAEGLLSSLSVIARAKGFPCKTDRVWLGLHVCLRSHYRTPVTKLHLDYSKPFTRPGE